MKTKPCVSAIVTLIIFLINIPVCGAVNVPSGFQVQVFASATNPTSMAFDQDGRLFVSEMGGSIKIFEDNDDNGVSDVVKTFATGVTMPLGIAFRGSDLYVANNPSDGQITVLQDTNADDVADVFNDIITGLPIGGHASNGMAFGPDDGKLYFTIGSTCNACNESDPRSATIMRADANGSNIEIYASGIRNPYDLTFNQRGDLFATDNGRDDLGDKQPREELNHIVQDGDYGWPECWGNNKQPNCGGKIKAIAKFAAHSSASGIGFYSKTQFPRAYRKNLFIARYGSSHLSEPTGRDVLRVKLRWRKRRSKYRTRVHTFATGFSNPLDVVEGPDGSLFVADFGANTIYKISYVGS